MRVLNAEMLRTKKLNLLFAEYCSCCVNDINCHIIPNFGGFSPKDLLSLHEITGLSDTSVPLADNYTNTFSLGRDRSNSIEVIQLICWQFSVGRRKFFED